MLPTFRILLATTGLAVLAVGVATYGLIPSPEVHTRIGEVPSIARPLIQQAMVPRLSIQALGDPAEERTGTPEMTGMSPGQVIVELPRDAVNSSDAVQTTTRPATGVDPSESSDPLGDLIKATMTQTPEPSQTIIAEPSPPQPPPSTGLRSSGPGSGSTATSAVNAAEPSSVAAEAASSLATKSAEIHGKDAAPVKTEDPAKAETEDTSALKPDGTARTDGKDAAPAKTEDAAKADNTDVPAPTARSLPPDGTPALALDDEDNRRGSASTGPRGKKMPALSSAGLPGKDAQDDDAKAVRQRPRKSASTGVEKQAIEKRKSRKAVERRAVRRKAVKKSQTASSHKRRKTMRQVKRSNRRVVEPAPRRGFVVVAPRRGRTETAKTRRSSATSSPAVQYLPRTYRYQVLPNGYHLYYPAPAGKTEVR